MGFLMDKPKPNYLYIGSLDLFYPVSPSLYKAFFLLDLPFVPGLYSDSTSFDPVYCCVFRCQFTTVLYSTSWTSETENSQEG